VLVNSVSIEVDGRFGRYGRKEVREGAVFGSLEEFCRGFQARFAYGLCCSGGEDLVGMVAGE